jgi:hypothetical protein
MFSQIHLGEAPSAQETSEFVIAKLLSNTIGHCLILSGEHFALTSRPLEVIALEMAAQKC